MKIWLVVGAVFAALTVLIGAFGAHGLKSKVSPEYLLIFETGVRYQMYHSLALVLIGTIGYYLPQSSLAPVGYFMIAGIMIFSGSLYLLVLTNIRWLGAVTPIGGIFFIIGWLLLAYNIYRS